MNLFEFAYNLSIYDSSKFLNDLAESLATNENVNDLQRQQWKEGEDFEGNILGIYSKMTEELSMGKKKAGDPYDLLDTGDFYSKTHIFNDKSETNLLLNFNSIGARNTGELLKKIGPRIFGLQKESIIKLTSIAQISANQLLSTNLKIK